MFGKFCLFPVVNSLVILFLIELFVNVLNSKGVLMFKDVSGKTAPLKTGLDVVVLWVIFNKNEQLLRTFQIKKKVIHISNLEMLRKLIASLYLLVCSTKKVLYYTIFVIIKADHLSKKKRQSDVFSLFIFLIKRLPGKWKKHSQLLLFALAQSLTHWCSCSVSCLHVFWLLLKQLSGSDFCILFWWHDPHDNADKSFPGVTDQP